MRARIRAMADAANVNHNRVQVIHAQFHPKYYEVPDGWKFKSTPVFALLREISKVVVSNWYWIQSPRAHGEAYEHEEYKTLEGYASYGARRYVKYLNWLNEIKLEETYCNEDINTEEFVRTQLPRLLDIEYVPTQEVVDHIMEISAQRINLIGADHDNVPDSVIEVIRREAQACRFPVYRERYL